MQKYKTPYKSALSPADSQAVDLVLDHASSQSTMTRLSPAVPPERVAAVTRLLQRLNDMPIADPPADLIAKTMARIDLDLADRPTHQPNVPLQGIPPTH